FGSDARSVASRSAFTQFHNVPSAISSDRATSATGRPEDFTSAIASRRNSAGYFAGRPTRASFLQGLPQNQVSTKAGQLHTASRTGLAAAARQPGAVVGGVGRPGAGHLRLDAPVRVRHRE